MKQILVILLLVMVLSSTNVFAAIPTLDYVYKSNTAGELNRPCFDSSINGWCSNETICQISVFDEQNNIIVLGANMTNQVSTHNYTLPVFNKTGVFKTDMACQTPANKTGYDTFFFGVNDAGRDYSGSYFMLYIIAGLAILFGVLAIILNEKLRLAFIKLTITMLPIGLWTASDIAANTWMGTSVINMINYGFYVSLIGYIAMVMYSLWSLLMQLKINKNAINTQNLSERGSPLYWNKKQDYAKKHPDRDYE